MGSLSAGSGTSNFGGKITIGSILRLAIWASNANWMFMFVFSQSEEERVVGVHPHLILRDNYGSLIPKFSYWQCKHLHLTQNSNTNIQLYKMPIISAQLKMHTQTSCRLGSTAPVNVTHVCMYGFWCLQKQSMLFQSQGTFTEMHKTCFSSHEVHYKDVYICYNIGCTWLITQLSLQQPQS